MATTGDWVTLLRQRHPLSRKASAALLDRRGRLSPLRLQRLRHPPADGARSARLRHPRLDLGATRLWRTRRLLRRPRPSSPASESSSSPASTFPNRFSPFFIALALYCFLTGLEDRKPARILPDVRLAGRSRVLAKGLHRSRLLPCRGRSVSTHHRRMAAAGGELRIVHRPSALPRHRRARGTSLPACAIPTTATPSATFLTAATSTASSTSISSMSMCCASSASAIRTTTTSSRGYVFWLGHLIWLFPWSIFVPVLSSAPGAIAALLAPIVRYNAADTIALPRSRSPPRRSGQPHGGAPTLPRPHRLAARPLRRLHPALLSHLDQSGVLHLPRLLPALVLYGALAAIAGPRRRRVPRNASQRLAHRVPRCLRCRRRSSPPSPSATVSGTSRGPPLSSPTSARCIAHRGVGGYSLSMSHVLRPHRAILRGPAPARRHRCPGPPCRPAPGLDPAPPRPPLRSHRLRRIHRRRLPHRGAHRTRPLRADCSRSHSMADTINHLAAPDDQLILYGDQADGSSIIFYTHRQALLVNGAPSSMIWGS